MVTWWERRIYSLLSVSVASFVCEAILSCWDATTNHNGHLDISGFFYPYWEVVLICSLPGWAVATPFVFSVTNIRGWRFWMDLAIGCGIGPLLILSVALYEILFELTTVRFADISSLFFFGTAVSIGTTIIYLLLLRRAQARANKKKDVLKTAPDGDELISRN